MNQTRITVHVVANDRESALFKLLCSYYAIQDNLGHTTSGASDDSGSFRADIETITVPDDESESPQYATPMPCPGCKKLCDREGKCTNTGCAFGPDDEEVIPPVDTRVSTR